MKRSERISEIRYQHKRYGFLAFSPGYLESDAFSTIDQDLANLCAFLLAFAEHQSLMAYQLGHLPSILVKEDVEKLTRREREVLLGVIKGQSNTEIAQSLGVEPTTIHTHRKRLYKRLGVHSAQEAILRSFEYQLVDWFDKLIEPL